MRSMWKLCFCLLILQNNLLEVFSYKGHHHHDNGLVHILAAGLIAHLLTQHGHEHHKSHHHHHGHESRHNTAYANSWNHEARHPAYTTPQIVPQVQWSAQIAPQVEWNQESRHIPAGGVSWGQESRVAFTRQLHPWGGYEQYPPSEHLFYPQSYGVGRY